MESVLEEQGDFNHMKRGQMERVIDIEEIFPP